MELRDISAACVAMMVAACSPAAAPSRQDPGSGAAPPPSVVPVSPSPTQPVASPAPPRFHGTISRLPADLAAEMRGTTWRTGCPVPLRDLRLLSLSSWDLDGEAREGPMVVHADAARDVVGVFRKLFRARFQIGEMRLSEEYHPEEDNPHSKVSITASFNCRVTVTPAGPGNRFSVHSWGLAIDINPLQNPYVRADGFTRNKYARRYVDRAQDVSGMIHDGDVVVRAFEKIGWTWGGHWSGGVDYMHFSINGR